MNTPVKRVLVVGGGSAGWITAAYMNAVLNTGGPDSVTIAVVESPRIGRIGVGEATVPTIRHVLQTIGLDERAFMRATDATFKQAIRFDGWLDGGDEHYYHPFDRRSGGPVDRAGATWMASDRRTPFAKTVSTQPFLCDAGLAPRMPGTKDFGSPLPYAYHMDAERFADYLCAHATARGVTHYQDDVTDVEMTETGHIAAVQTAGGLRLDADLFVDCTGFAGLLIEKALGAGFTDYSPWLLCDSAIAMRVPYDVHDPGVIRPFTTARALSAGWCWDIGLQNRRGLGYVYASQFLDADSAEAELRALEGAHAQGLPARALRFRVGRRTAAWTANCVSIGLASGFIEPLESTGLYLSEFAAVTLCELFPHHGVMVPLARRFNTILANRYEEILDFVNLHYCLTRRQDTPFWREVRKAERVTERLRDKLSFWALKPPSQSDFDDHFRLFSYQSYEYILYGMNFLGTDGSGRPPLPVPPHVAKVVEAARTRLPAHRSWLQQELGTG